MFEIFQYDFMIKAMLAGLLASIAFGIVGTYVVVKRIVFISGGISHSAYGGIGLGFLLGFDPTLGALGAAVLAAGVMAFLRKQKRQHEDLLIGIMWALGMSLGILFIDLTPGYKPDLMSYLFGNILTITTADLYLMLILDAFIAVSVYLFYHQFRAITFDEEYARSIGIKVDLLYLLLFIIIAVTTVLLIKIVGIILVIAMLSIPGAISLRFAKSIGRMMILSVGIGAIITISGIILSFYIDVASGAAIILIGSVLFFGVHFYGMIKK